MDMWIIWLIIMGVLLIVEVLTQMMLALCLAVGCLAALICSLCGVDVIWQIIATAIAAVAGYIFLVPLFQKWHALSVDKKGRASMTGMDALLGRKTIVMEEVRPFRPGRARIDGDNWQIRSRNNDETIAKGREVVVKGYDSIVLIVDPVSSQGV